MIVFPGVGSFGSAMETLNDKGFTEPLTAYIKQDRPFFGICLGMQVRCLCWPTIAIAFFLFVPIELSWFAEPVAISVWLQRTGVWKRTVDVLPSFPLPPQYFQPRVSCCLDLRMKSSTESRCLCCAPCRCCLWFLTAKPKGVHCVFACNR